MMMLRLGMGRQMIIKIAHFIRQLSELIAKVFLGARATDTQALQWPRTGVRKPDTYVNTYAVGFPFRISTDYFTDTEIPDQVKERRQY